jgi:hypothetical protein
LGQAGYGIVELRKVLPSRWRGCQRFVERHSLRAAPTLGVPPRPGEIDQNPTHQSGGHGERMDSVLPLHLLSVNQPEVLLAD